MRHACCALRPKRHRPQFSGYSRGGTSSSSAAAALLLPLLLTVGRCSLIMNPLLLALPARTPKGSSFVLDAAADDDSMLCTSTDPVSLDEGFAAAAPPPPPLMLLLLLLLDLMHG